MTRDFDKQQRDDSRPPSRDVPSNQYGEERSQPTRPRLNREMVDRAWENGAQRVHADYNARSNNHGAPPRNAWRNQNNAGNSAQKGPGSYRSYGSRPGSGRSYHDEQRPYSRPYDARYNPSEQRYDNRRGNSSEQYRSNGRPGFNDRTQPQGPGGQFRDQGRPGFNDRMPSQGRPGFNNRAPGRPGFNDRTPADRPGFNNRTSPGRPGFNDRTPSDRPGFNNRAPDRPGFNDRTPSDRPSFNNRAPGRPGFNDRTPGRGPQYRGQESNYGRRDFDRNGQAARDFGHDRGFRPGGFNARTTPNEPPPLNPRLQSRPQFQREQREARLASEQAEQEQFEGDYEYLVDKQEQKPAPTRNPRKEYQQEHGRKAAGQNKAQERYVTPLPDGRVLKGPRAAQRKGAEFWTGIAEDAETLMAPAAETSRGEQQAVASINEVEEEPISEPAALAVSESSEADLEAKQEEQTASIEEQEGPQGEVSKGKSPGRRIASAVRRKKADPVKKPRSSGPKPSQRGYQWPKS